MKKQFKICLLGEGAVGKTSIKNRLLTGKFTSQYMATLGVDFGVYSFTLGDVDIQFAIWDIAGQKNFDLIRDGYFESSKAGIIVFDVTKPESMIKIKDHWLVPFYNKLQNKIPVIIIANKIDLNSERNISKEQMNDFFTLLQAELEIEKLPIIETSAKDGTNVTKSMELLAELLLE